MKSNTSKKGKKEKATKKRNPKGHWHDAINAVRDISAKHSGLTASQKAVLTALALRMNSVDKACHPSQETLAEDTCLTRKTVRAATRQLEDDGLIKREKIRKGNGGQHYRYHFNLVEIGALHRKNFTSLIGGGMIKFKKPKIQAAGANDQTKQWVDDGTSKGELTDTPMGSGYPQSKEQVSKEDSSKEGSENLGIASGEYQIPASPNPGDFPSGKVPSSEGVKVSSAETSNPQQCNQLQPVVELGAPIRPDCIDPKQWKTVMGCRDAAMSKASVRVKFLMETGRFFFPNARRYRETAKMSSVESNTLHRYFDVYGELAMELITIGMRQHWEHDTSTSPNIGDLWKDRDNALAEWGECVSDDRVFKWNGTTLSARDAAELLWECNAGAHTHDQQTVAA